MMFSIARIITLRKAACQEASGESFAEERRRTGTIAPAPSLRYSPSVLSRSKNCTSFADSSQSPAITDRQREYREVYLRSDHWRRVREFALEDAENRCAVCNSGFSLDVHHRTYERLGNERPRDVLVLCRTCHDIFHRNGRLIGSTPRPQPKRKPKPYSARKTYPRQNKPKSLRGTRPAEDHKAIVLIAIGGSASTTKEIATRARYTTGAAGKILAALRDDNQVVRLSDGRWKRILDKPRHQSTTPRTNLISQWIEQNATEQIQAAHTMAPKAIAVSPPRK